MAKYGVDVSIQMLAVGEFFSVEYKRTWIAYCWSHLSGFILAFYLGLAFRLDGEQPTVFSPRKFVAIVSEVHYQVFDGLLGFREILHRSHFYCKLIKGNIFQGVQEILYGFGVDFDHQAHTCLATNEISIQFVGYTLIRNSRNRSFRSTIIDLVKVPRLYCVNGISGRHCIVFVMIIQGDSRAASWANGSCHLLFWGSCNGN